MMVLGMHLRYDDGYDATCVAETNACGFVGGRIDFVL